MITGDKQVMLLPFYCFVWFAFTKESFKSDLEKLSLSIRVLPLVAFDILVTF